ncbi:MAG: LytR C-terminal domain-containing protein [Firmicutes bacterium]|nr:LytR C-terminal domain-containing protein [Bacillota bacterium]
MSKLFKAAGAGENLENQELLSEDSTGQRVKSRRRILIASAISTGSILVILIVALLAFGFMATGEKSNSKHKSSDKASIPAKNSTKRTEHANKSQLNNLEQKTIASLDSTSTPMVKQILNTLIIGVDNSGVNRNAKGILFARIDTLSGVVQAINIPERTYLNVSGVGVDQIGQTYADGLDSTKRTVEDLLQVQVDSHIIMRYEDFDYLVSGSRFKIAFERAIETSFSESEKNLYAKEVAKIDLAKVSVFPLPVRLISINGEPYYEPNNEEIGRLLESLWGIKMLVKTETTRVLILNGSGQPGVGRVVSDKLKAGGFIIVDVKNASNFNYKKTIIVAYKENYMDKAQMVQRLLGTGEVIYHSVAQDVAEIAVIIGADFKAY